MCETYQLYKLYFGLVDSPNLKKKIIKKCFVFLLTYSFIQSHPCALGALGRFSSKTRLAETQEAFHTHTDNIIPAEYFLKKAGVEL